MEILFTTKQLVDFESDIAECFNSSQIKAPVHLYDGNEQQMIDIFKQVQPHDWIFCSWRSHYQCLLKGVPSTLVKEEILNGKSIALVMHPGYWRVDFPQKLFFYLKNFKFILKDIFLFIHYGNLGTWSKNRRSRAFVSRSNRRKYYCGAVWFGKKNDILNLATELDTYTDFDLKNKNIPEWNDESYLNYWASKNDFVSLTPSFCYEESYKNLEYLNPFIIAVDKEKYENISK